MVNHWAVSLNLNPLKPDCYVYLDDGFFTKDQGMFHTAEWAAPNNWTTWYNAPNPDGLTRVFDDGNGHREPIPIQEMLPP